MGDVKVIRALLGLSQAELAEKLGVHQSIVSRWETGDLPVADRTLLALDALMMRAGVAHCCACDARADSEIAACTSVACPSRQREAA